MANTTVSSDLVVTNYLSDFYREFVRENMFSPYTGTSNANVINIKMDKQKIEIPLVTRLTGQGVSGSSTLRGNGEAISNYGMTLTPTYYRHAVEFDREELEKPNIDLMKAARPLLMDWSMELVRDHVIEAMGAVSASGTYYKYGSASAANRNTWAVANSDRVLYGSTTANYSGVHATDLAKVDTTADGADKEIISLMKRLAKNADPHIRPIRVKGGYEYFVAFCDSYVFRDIKSDLATSHQNAMPRSRDNILFQDGDLVWDGVIIREVPEIGSFIDGGSPLTGGDWSSLATAGDSSKRVSPIFLCGQQAVGYGLGQKPRIIVDRTYDYEFQPGVACEHKLDIDKAFFNGDVQHGMVTAFVSAVAD